MSIEKEIEQNGVYTILDQQGWEWYLTSSNGTITVQKILNTKNGSTKYIRSNSRRKNNSFRDGNGY